MKHAAVASSMALMAVLASAAVGADPVGEDRGLLAELKNYPYRIVHESYRDNRWVLVTVAADGSNPTVLTRTPGVNEQYPHVSPDGKKICFVSDEGEGKAKRRNVYLMNMDGMGRMRIADAARDPCWTPDGKCVVYLKDEVEELQRKDFATKGLFVYDLASGKAVKHVNDQLHHLYNVCCTADGNWYVSTVHAGMGYSHAILAIAARGQGVYDLKIPGCRPDLSPDGKRLAWGAGDCVLRVADLEIVGGKPKVTHARDVATSIKSIHIYHIDWSPDSRYVAFSRGPNTKVMGLAPEMVGVKAEGWNLCVADAAKTDRWVQLTTDGRSNKEPDWYPSAK